MTNAEAQFNNSLRPRKPEGSLGRTAQNGHLDSHTAPELCETEEAWTVLKNFIPKLRQKLDRTRPALTPELVNYN